MELLRRWSWASITKLHRDMSYAVNILVHTADMILTPQKPAKIKEMKKRIEFKIIDNFIDLLKMITHLQMRLPTKRAVLELLNFPRAT